jgi:hypothetical protein
MYTRLLVFAGSSPIHVAEVLYKHVGGGDVKLMMKVRPATTPRRHQARLLVGDDGAAKTLKRGAMRPVLRDEAGAAKTLNLFQQF